MYISKVFPSKHFHSPKLVFLKFSMPAGTDSCSLPHSIIIDGDNQMILEYWSDRWEMAIVSHVDFTLLEPMYSLFLGAGANQLFPSLWKFHGIWLSTAKTCWTEWTFNLTQQGNFTLF